MQQISSRAAWVSLALHETERPKEFVRQGLKHDSENEYCQNLADKLQMQDEFLV